MRDDRNKTLGTSMIEFAILCPILILLVFGIVEVSLLYYDKHVIIDASREGARYGVSSGSSGYPTSTQVINYTKTFCANNLLSFNTSPSLVSVTATPSATPAKSGDNLIVTVTYPYTGLVLYLLINKGQTYNLSASTTMTYQ